MQKAMIIIALLCIAAVARAEVKEEQVTYKQGNINLKGYLYYDDAVKGPRPGILVVHEWWGLNEYSKRRARSLAEEGYIALAVDMYGEGKTTEHPKTAGEWSNAVTGELRNARFGAAYELLRTHELTDKKKIAAIGYCFGGGVVLREALAGADLVGVVSFHGALPTEGVEPGMAKAKILVCHGAADPFNPPDQVVKFWQVLDKSGADWEFIAFGGAKHSFTSKEADSHGIPALAYNEAADRRSWAAMNRFFKEIFGD